VELFLSALFFGELGDTWQLGQTAIRKSLVAGFHQGWWFSAMGMETGEGPSRVCWWNRFQENVTQGVALLV
jgi:hypothetical protein